MNDQQYITLNGCQAVAHVAYRTNEVCAIYPITPSSEMSELVEAWSADGQENIFGDVPSVFEMQGEGGVAGALHGALQTGSLATTFTASQGLLLMMPNMFKIAGELTPNVIHVGTRSVATHALSVFGDHSDIMAVRNTGYAFLGAGSVQEAMDFALISQAATLVSRIPFVHFFDGFRTSHETSKIHKVTDKVIGAMIPKRYVDAHNKRALNPNTPVIRGTSQGPDVFFQGREAVNTIYDACPDIVQEQMDRFAKLTGRQYRLFDYVGHPKAEQVIVAMASASETIDQTVAHLNAQGEKIGLIKVRLFRPFSTEHLIQALPKSCKAIAVLDRTKEPGATGEPLYMDVVQSLALNYHVKFKNMPKVVGGRYGLSSKEFTPGMVKAVVQNLRNNNPKHNFTLGILDDVTFTHLEYESDFLLENDHFQALFYHTKTAHTATNFDDSLKFLGNNTNQFVQGYLECDYKKSDALGVAHMRISQRKIEAPYLINKADLVVCDHIKFLNSELITNRLSESGTLLLNTKLSETQLLAKLPADLKYRVKEKNVSLFLVDLEGLPDKFHVNGHELSAIYACFFSLTGYLPRNLFSKELQGHIIPVRVNDICESNTYESKGDSEFERSLLGRLLKGNGDTIPVGMLPLDGTFETGTSSYNTRDNSGGLPIWDKELCTQCGACSMACPQGALRTKAFPEDMVHEAPDGFKSVSFLEPIEGFDLLQYTVQVNPEQCTSCNNCVDACPVKALTFQDSTERRKLEKENWDFLATVPEFDRTKLDTSKIVQQQLQEPLFKYAMGDEGCGEAPYLKLLSQLYGDRMLVANATGASSIFGGALPTTPWSKNQAGRGPAWSNSLFEDNAEFGLGFRLSLDHKKLQAENLLLKLVDVLDKTLVDAILNAPQQTDAEIFEQRTRLDVLAQQLQQMDSREAQKLIPLLEHLLDKSVWIVGGDGWAYDIGYGGLDHVLASGKNVNILVLDNEVYSNTGGQMSKATPFAAQAKFAARGKQKQKKDLGLLAMGYSNVYVASVAIGADQEQTLKAFKEAEQHNGPSLIIAYCHSPSHGIDMKRPSQYHKAAVASGQWLLYRNDPNRMSKGMNPMQLDSSAPNMPIEEYYRMEKRFDKVFEKDPTAYNSFLLNAQQRVFEKYACLQQMELQQSAIPTLEDYIINFD
nr:4Fe-4S binding protein [Allomuricauda sp.]